MTSDPAPLAILSATALLAVAVMVVTVRGDIVAEHYAIARCQQEASCLERRARSVRVDLVVAFARRNPALNQGAVRGDSRSWQGQPSPLDLRGQRDGSELRELIAANTSTMSWLP